MFPSVKNIFDYKRRQKSIVQYSFDAFVFSHYITGKVKTQEKFFNKQQITEKRLFTLFFFEFLHHFFFRFVLKGLDCFLI